MKPVSALIADIFTPSARDESPYLSMLIAIGHAVLGAAMPIWGAGPVAAMRLAAVYWIAKDRRDLRKGGGWRDGLIDTAFVALGAFYGQPWWPLLVIFAAIWAAILTHD